jgi:RimJ/RimL family protein N-acetyltransferase
MVGRELFGEMVKLRSLRQDDLFDRIEWLNDTEIVRLFTGALPSKVYAIADAERWRQILESDLSSVVWAIDTKTGRHIGDIDIHSIDRVAHTGKLTVLIGEKAFWNQGYGTDTIRTLLRYVFFCMGLSTVCLRVYDFNLRAMRCYERCGFKRMDATETGEICMSVDKPDLMAEEPNVFSI